VASATLGIARAIAARTPVDTGRAKGSWVARPPGMPEQRVAREITAEEQARIKAQRRKAAQKAKAKARRQAVKAAKALADVKAQGRSNAKAARAATRKSRTRG
jgi:hypothetical protein